MVQDMMDPEFYVTKNDGGRFMKYKDATTTTTTTMNLAERQPIVLVPLPFVSDWFHNYNDNSISTNTVVEANIESKSSRKRPFNHGNEDNYGCSTMNKKQSPAWDSNPHTFSQDSNDSSNSSHLSDQNPNMKEDWWPQGCMGSQPDQCAILAKVDYDDFPKKKKFQLNSIVQVIGILGSCNDDDDEEDGNNDEMMMDLDVWEDAFVQIPSSLPRLFVLNYQPLELNSMTLSHIPPPTTTLSFDDDRAFTIQMLNENVFHGNHKVAAEALLVSLLSMAERKKIDDTVIQMPSGSTLGCASLKLLVGDNDTFSFCRTLHSVLKEILPIVTKVDLYLSLLNAPPLTTTTTSMLHPIVAPEKNHHGRMDPSIMQLPKSSCMILNEGALTPGSLHAKGQRALECLSKLTQHHSIPYQFGGMMEIPFEADYRMIVVSKSEQKQQPPHQTNNKLMPCHLVMKVGKMRIEDNDDDGRRTCALPVEATTRVRSYLAKCRSYGNVDLSQEVLKTAERVFLERRQSHKETVREDDFHRWLTLTRLQARSRQQQMAQIEDWNAALRLDDSMFQSRS